MTTPSAYQPAPVIDIVSFGYKRLFRMLWPITVLSLPFVVVAGLAMGLVYPEYVQAIYHNGKVTSFQEPAYWRAVFLLYGASAFAGLLMFYASNAVNLPYIRDHYANTVRENLFSYWLPRKKAWGVIAIGLLLTMIGGLVMVIGVMGLFLFILPGLAVFVGGLFLAVRYALVLPIYIDQPEAGPVKAFEKSWQLTSGFFWATVGVFLMVFLLNALINMPFSLLNGVLSFVVTYQYMAVNALYLPVVYSVMFILMYWVNQVLGLAGLSSVGYRHYLNLTARKQLSESADSLKP